MQAAARPAVCIRSGFLEGLTPALSLEPADRSTFVFLQRRIASMLEHFFGAQVLESVIEHQPADDPTTEAELVEPLDRVAVERLCVSQRVERCRLDCWRRHAPTARPERTASIRQSKLSWFCNVLIVGRVIEQAGCGKTVQLRTSPPRTQRAYGARRKHMRGGTR